MADPITTALMIAGTAISAGGSILGGVSQNRASRAEAASMENGATQTRASSQRAASEKAREVRTVQSRQQAIAAKGGGAGDQGVIDLMTKVGQDGALQTANILYEGSDQARTIHDQAAATRAAGKQALVAGILDGATSLVSGGAQIAGKFKGPGEAADLVPDEPPAPAEPAGQLYRLDSRIAPQGGGERTIKVPVDGAPMPPVRPAAERMVAQKSFFDGLTDFGTTMLSGGNPWARWTNQSLAWPFSGRRY